MKLQIPNLSKELPLVVSDGMGVDSTALLIGLNRAGFRPDLILFADTGAEKDETYAYIEQRQRWLVQMDFPSLTIVKYEPKNFKNYPPYFTLEDNCLTNGTLPSLAFGFKSCSQKWKIAPQDRFMKAYEPAIKAWANGEKVQKLIGYDAGPADLRRRNHAGSMEDPSYVYFYPLIEWGWDREACKNEIAEEGEPVPLKSSCFFCPAMKPDEVMNLPEDRLRRIVAMEARAEPRLDKVEGLWRSSTKKRPGKMTDFIRAYGLLADPEIDEIIESVPTEIVSYQEGYAQALVEGHGAVEDFVRNHRSYTHGHPHKN